MSPLLALDHFSPHFPLAELVRTDVRDLYNEPGPEEIDALFRLCAEFLEPVRARFGPLRIHSGYRSEEVNARIGGAKLSSHRFGCAADFHCLDGASSLSVLRWLRDESGLAVDQAIDEESVRGPPGWIHLGICPPWLAAPRHQFLVMRHGAYSPLPE